MPQTINTNVSSLNAQRNLNTSQSSWRPRCSAVLGPARQLRPRTTPPPAWRRRPHELADPRHQRRDPQRQRRHPLAQTAEGALVPSPTCCSACANSSIQAQNGSNGSGDRANLDTEFQQLSAEITRIAQQQTKFNGTAIVGSGAGAQTFQVGANNGDTMTITTSTVATVTGNILTAGAASTAVADIDAQLDAIDHQPRHLRRRDEPLRVRHPATCRSPAKPERRARPHHGCGLRGRDRQPVALADPAAGRHGDGGAGQPGAAAGAAAVEGLNVFVTQRGSSGPRPPGERPARIGAGAFVIPEKADPWPPSVRSASAAA